MQYKLLGSTGLRVSEIGIGTLNFGETKSWGVSTETAGAILAAFADAGGTLLDTAPNYAGGAAEEIVGGFLHGQRDNFVVSTKYTASNDTHVLAGGNSLRNMIRSTEDSLRRLGTDYIDILWLHYWDGTAPLAEILKGFENLIAAGKIRYFGFSDTPAWLVARAVTMADLRGWALPAAIQVEYNLAAREAERELLPMADALGLGTFAWGPLAAGALAHGPAAQRRSRDSLRGHLRAISDMAGAIAAQSDLSPVALAMRWLLRRSGRSNVVPLVGARTAEQLAATLSAADGELDQAIIDKLDAETAPKLGFPHDLIGSSYLRRLALGTPQALQQPGRPRS